LGPQQRSGNAVKSGSKDDSIGCVSPKHNCLMDRRTLLKAATGSAAKLCALGALGKSYQRALAQGDVVSSIVAIPGDGAQPTEADMELVGELCLRSTKRGAFSGQTVTFIGLNNAGYHNNVFRPLSRAWEEFTGATVLWIDVPQEEMFSKIQQGAATGEIEFDVMEAAAAWEGDILGRGLANPMPNWVKEQVDLSDYVKLLQAPVGTWEDVTYRMSIDGACHNFNYRSDVFSSPELAQEWSVSGGEGDWAAPTTWQQVQAQTLFLNGQQIDGNDIYGYLDVIKPSSGFSWYFFASRASAYAKNQESPAWLFDPATMTPFVNNPAFVQALNDIVDVIDAEPPDQMSADYLITLGQFLGGVGAMSAWWGDVGKSPQTNFPPVPRDKMSFSILPGSLDVYSNVRGEWDRIGARQLNFAPNDAFIGWGLYVMQKAGERGVAEAAWDLAAHLGGKDLSMWTAIYPSGFQPYRYSNFDVRYWAEAGYPREFVEAYLASAYASYNHPNRAVEPRIPAIFDYYIAAEDEVALAVAGEKSAQEALDSAAERWEEITDRNGRESQIGLYQAALSQ
jgi:multiple sugar transport system substrate-binding protein